LKGATGEDMGNKCNDLLYAIAMARERCYTAESKINDNTKVNNVSDGGTGEEDSNTTAAAKT
jgi:hypothetical protein